MEAARLLNAVAELVFFVLGAAFLVVFLVFDVAALTFTLLFDGLSPTWPVRCGSFPVSDCLTGGIALAPSIALAGAAATPWRACFPREPDFSAFFGTALSRAPPLTAGLDVFLRVSGRQHHQHVLSETGATLDLLLDEPLPKPVAPFPPAWRCSGRSSSSSSSSSRALGGC